MHDRCALLDSFGTQLSVDFALAVHTSVGTTILEHAIAAFLGRCLLCGWHLGWILSYRSLVPFGACRLQPNAITWDHAQSGGGHELRLYAGRLFIGVMRHSGLIYPLVDVHR